jgi:hypothetical protein
MDDIASVVIDNGSGMCKAGCTLPISELSYISDDQFAQLPATMRLVLYSRMYLNTHRITLSDTISVEPLLADPATSRP